MIRITATKHDKARLEIIEYDILAWLSGQSICWQKAFGS